MVIKFYGLTSKASALVENILIHENVKFKLETDDFDGLNNIEIINYENSNLTINAVQDDIVLHGKDARTHFSISEVEKITMM